MKLLVLDGNSILNRSFYGIKILTNKEGQYTNAIYGFLTTLNKLNEEVNPDSVAIAFDMRSPTFRHKMYDGYKSKRKGMPEELAAQLPILKELLKYLGYNLVECEGFEADDIIGTLATNLNENNDECIIATGDRDSLQLVSKNITVRIAYTKFGKPQVTFYDEEKVKEVYGVTPKELIDIKALQGDTSDNIPGVKGIGEKGATDLIQKFHSIDYIYKNVNTIDIKETVRKKLVLGEKSAFMSKMLGLIRTDVPIDTDINSYIMKKCDVEKAKSLMTELQLFSLIDKIVFEDYSDNKNLIEISFDDGTFVCNGKIYNINKGDDLRGILEDCSLSKQTVNSKFIFSECCKKNIDIKNIDFDITLAEYLLDSSAKHYNIKEIIEKYAVSNLEELVSVMNNEILKCDQLNLLCEVEIPLSKVLSEMELVGFLVDQEGIRSYEEMLNIRLIELQKEIYSSIGYEFNVNSPKQLGQVLFENLGLPKGKKNKNGYSTSAEVLKNMVYLHPSISSILEYRTLSKLKSTYCDGMLKVIAEDGRIHSNFNQTETRTGRISSTEPNLQNIPVRTDVGRQMRRFFIARNECVLVDADYSQIELRILACIADDENMKKAFAEGLDIHTETASEVFHIAKNMVTPMMRSRAKAVNFGIVYGIGAFSLSKDIKVTIKEAQTYIDNYFSHYSKIKQYLDEVVKSAKKNGYAETMFGRRRYLPELSSSNFNLRSFGERVAMNMPIQGSSADIIKKAMIRVSQRLIKEKLKSKLILQIHDELIVEAPLDEAEYVKSILKEEMEGCVKLDIPLIIEASIGRTWYDSKE